MKGVLVNNLQFNCRLDLHSDPRSPLFVSTPPLGPLLLGAILKERGFPISLADFAVIARCGGISTGDRFYQEAAEHLLEMNPDWIGFTTRCDNYHCTLKIAREVKERSPRTTLIFGGPQATVTDVDSLRIFPQVDLIVRNEAEETLPELLELMRDGGDLAEISGVSWRRQGEAVRNPDRPLIRDLNLYPAPDYSLYTRSFEGRWPIEVGRGCPFGCTFCSTNVYFDRSYRLKSGERILAEIRHLMERFGATEFTFVHDMFTVDKRRVLEICRVLEESGLNFVWDCSARLDGFNDETLAAMRRAGCDNIYMGIETGSQRMQKIVKKNLKLAELAPKIGRLKELGFGVTTSFITGFEDETKEDVSDTIETLVNCVFSGVDLVQLHLCAPLRGAPSYTVNRGHFAFDGYFSDQVDPIFFSAEDEALIRAHQEVFSAFYYVEPKHLSRSFYHGLDFYGYITLQFRHTLYYILHACRVSALDIFLNLKTWLEEHHIAISVSGSLDMRRFHDLFTRFLRQMIQTHFFDFPYLGDILDFDLHLAAFSRAHPYRSMNSVALEDSGLPLSSIPRLTPNVEIATYSCDIGRLIERVNARLEPEVTVELSRCTHVALKRNSSGVDVVTLPVVAKAIVELCDGLRDLDSIRAILLERLPHSWPTAMSTSLITKLTSLLSKRGILNVHAIAKPAIAGGSQIRSACTF